jgi:hypothetical protein
MYTDLEYAASNAEEIRRTLPGLKDISFPGIQKWWLVSRIEFLTSLDLSHAGDITFHSTGPMNRFFAPIPSQLTELALSQVSFTIESLPGGQRYFLPCLTTLTLLDVTFSGPISDYFHCPKLDCVGHFIKSLDVRSNILVQEIFDVAFYRESLALKTIYLEGLTITDVLVPPYTSWV